MGGDREGEEREGGRGWNEEVNQRIVVGANTYVHIYVDPTHSLILYCLQVLLCLLRVNQTPSLLRELCVAGQLRGLSSSFLLHTLHSSSTLIK